MSRQQAPDNQLDVFNEATWMTGGGAFPGAELAPTQGDIELAAIIKEATDGPPARRRPPPRRKPISFAMAMPGNPFDQRRRP